MSPLLYLPDGGVAHDSSFTFTSSAALKAIVLRGKDEG